MAAKASAAAVAASAALELEHPAFAPVVSLPFPGASPLFLPSPSSSNAAADDGSDGGEAAPPVPFTTLVVRPLHPSDVRETTEALLSAFKSDSDPPERSQLERRLERESRRYSEVDPGPWLLHSIELPPPRFPRTEEEDAGAGAGAGDAGDAEEKEGTGIEGEAEGAASAPPPSSPNPPGRWSSLPFRGFSGFGGGGFGLPGSLKERRAAELEARREERAAAAWEEALEDAWGRWLWLVAEARSSEGEGGGKKGRKRRIVGAAALLFHDRSYSLRALERLASSDFASAMENRRRWPRPNAASMDYCLWLRERFPAAGWPPSPPSPSRRGKASPHPPPSSSGNLGGGGGGGGDSSENLSEGVFGRSASLWWVGTLPEARGRGVGAALLDASSAVAAAAGFHRLFAQVEEWSGGGGGGGRGLESNRGRRSGGLIGAPWLGIEEGAISASSAITASSSAVERMYRSAGFVAVPEPPREGGERSVGWGGGAVDQSALLLQKSIW